MLEELADDQGRIYYTSNTGKLLDEATEFGLVRPVYGEFRAIEPGCLNSLYRLTRMN